MLAGTGAAAAAFFCSASRASPSEHNAQIHQTRCISHQADLYHGWPTLARRKSGELLLAYSGGRERHVCPFGRVELMRSHNEGKTWGWPRVIIDTEIDDRDAGVMETDKGTLLITTFTSIGYAKRLAREVENVRTGKSGAWSEAHLNRWQAAHNRLTDRQRKSLLGLWMLRSADGGLTWSLPYDSLVRSNHGPSQLSDGRLLIAGRDLYRGRRVGVCQSSDDGLTWRWLADFPSPPDGNIRECGEIHLVEAADGKIVAHIRDNNHPQNSKTLQSESSDGGKTWTEPRSIGVWGLPSHLLQLKDGRLLMTYGHRRQPFGNQARVSDDNGHTWSEPIIISADGANTDLGYPSTVQLSDGSLLTVWYEKLRTSPRAVLRQANWSLK